MAVVMLRTDGKEVGSEEANGPTVFPVSSPQTAHRRGSVSSTILIISILIAKSSKRLSGFG
jgi:hypothetical protein